jgi:hypothetical protein
MSAPPCTAPQARDDFAWALQPSSPLCISALEWQQNTTPEQLRDLLIGRAAYRGIPICPICLEPE